MPQQKPEKPTEVLIVGAGPSGLMMASQLAIHGIDFRIIDKKAAASSYSGALIVHARSVEIFEQMGIAERIVGESIIANDLSIVVNGKKTVKISLRDIGKGLTKFPNLYLIEQSKTEQLLIDFVASQGFSVERKTVLKSFTQDETGVVAVLTLADGKEETVKTNYLIGADGGHSFVREQLNIPFVGKTHPIPLFITDCKAETDLPSEEICFSFSNASTSGFFPMKNGRKRIDGLIPKELAGSKHIEFNDIEKGLAKRLQMKIKLYDPEWFSVSYSNQRYALSYQKNRCFLVGDSAHTFTPVGAQGMNTGMQDAYNLAWKLALVIRGKAKSSLLDTYSEERKNIAKKIGRTTGKIYNLVTSQNSFTKTVRLYVLPHLMKYMLPLIEKQQPIRRFCFNAISEIGINYRKGQLQYEASLGTFPAIAPLPGDRLPFLVYGDTVNEINIQDKIKASGFTLFIFTNDAPSAEIKRVAEKYENVFSLEAIPLLSATKFLYDRFGVKEWGCYLIRPDMHIAYRSNVAETRHFERYLQHNIANF